MKPKWILLLGLICGTWPQTGNCADQKLVVRWDFHTEELTPLQAHGGVHRDVPGPRPSNYPDFDANNTAVKLDGDGAYLSLDDPGSQSPFDFINGDEITLEAWVMVEDIQAREFVYVVGKGRTESPGFTADNQNWALRIRESGGKVGISFLFATERKSDVKTPDSHWHRWATKDGFSPSRNWHHIAVTYKFGDASSIRGWIDGQPQIGSWDMGGPTAEPPIVDNDAIWIGSSRGGAARNSFRGSLDAVAIHREVLSDSVLQKRFRREGAEVVEKPVPEVMPVLTQLSPGRSLAVFREGMPSHTRWLNEGESLPAVAMSMPVENILFNRLPQRFDAWGIRDRWKGPVLVQFATETKLTPGKHRFLMRVRGLGRLWVNGNVIARSKPLGSSPSGEEPMTPVAAPPVPGLRIAEHRQQEVFGDVEIAANGRCRVVLETIVGTKDLRTDPGEQCVAVQSDDGAMFVLLSAAGTDAQSVPLTDVAVEAAMARAEHSLQSFDNDNRRRLAASQNSFWSMRHRYAQSWAAANPAPMVPNAADKASASHPIDSFLAAKIDKAVAASSKTPTDPRDLEIPPIVSDVVFLRRIYLDTVGVPPTEPEIRAFLADTSPEKRVHLIDRLLADERWTDHWISYWQDVLAENPTLLNPSLNTTGPFRWFLFDSLRDNKPFDQIVTELILLRGDPHEVAGPSLPSIRWRPKPE